jgi:hypothetical protein
MLQEERRNKTALYNPMTIAEVGCLNNDDILKSASFQLRLRPNTNQRVI